MARILAKALNCKEGPTDKPCGKCENCVEITNGASFDVIEIDGASNNSVDDIRDLREKVNFAPVKGKYKVYIIDEVHMVTSAAFNALLKTLEEPPAHIVFVFATTEYHKIPETILSRCQKFFFKKIPIDAIVSHLKHIAETEGFKISDAAIYPIARAADGAMRDAQSLLEQVISFSGENEINEGDVLGVLGIIPLESYGKHLDAIAAGDASALINELERIYGMGADIPRYAAGFIDCLRSLRLVKNGVVLKNIAGLSSEESAMFKRLADLYSDEELSRMFRVAMDLESDMRFAQNERINLEMALLDMLHIKQSPSLASVLAKLADVIPAEESPAAAAKSVAAAQTVATVAAEIQPKPESQAAPAKEGRQTSQGSGASQTEQAAEKIKEAFFGEIIEKKYEQQ